MKALDQAAKDYAAEVARLNLFGVHEALDALYEKSRNATGTEMDFIAAKMLALSARLATLEATDPLEDMLESLRPTGDDNEEQKRNAATLAYVQETQRIIDAEPKENLNTYETNSR